MIKNKYQRLNHEEKKKAREDFYKTDFGKEQKPRFDRLLMVSILLFLFSIYLLIDAIIKKDSIFAYIATFILFIFSAVFFIGRHKVIVKNVNSYLIKKKK